MLSIIDIMAALAVNSEVIQRHLSKPPQHVRNTFNCKWLDVPFKRRFGIVFDINFNALIFNKIERQEDYG